MRHDRFLPTAALLYGGGLALHTADHFRRGIDVVTDEVLSLGYVSTAVGIAVVALVLTGHRWAPTAAMVVGFAVAVGVSAVHLLPHWSTLSDAFPGADSTGVTAVSWAVVLIEIAGGLAMGIAGLAASRRTVPAV